MTAAPLLQAQNSGSLHGQVADPTGAIIPDARIDLSGPGGKTYTATSGGDGSYAFPTLPQGSYTLTVTVAGFTPFSESGVTLVDGASRSLDIPLSIANQEQQVEVRADTTQLDTSPENNANSVVISGKDLDALSDDPDELQNQLTALAGPAAGNGGSQIYIDGFTGGQMPPKSSIREIRINQNPFSAEFDKLGYGRIEILTKPGTDKLHGQFQTSGNSSAFNTSHFVSSTPSYHSYFLNGSVGGSISKKSSYFFSLFGRNNQNINIVNAAGSPSDPLGLNGNVVEALQNPSSRLHLSPRFYYQLTPSNTLTIRYQFDRGSDTGDGTGQYALASQAYNTRFTENTLQISDSQVITPRLVNETRFQYQRDRDRQTPQDTSPTLTVQGAFTGGGSNDGISRTSGDHYELQNYSTATIKDHTLRFGARLRAYRESDYSNAGSNGNYIFASAADFVASRPSQGSVTQIVNPLARATLFDAGVFYQDDWKVNQKFTLNYGLRFESQNRIHDHADWGPRVGFAYAVDGGGKRPPRTVIRAGYGWFYNRFGNSNVIQAIHQNGFNEKQVIYQDPIYTPGQAPTGTATTDTRSGSYSISSHMRAALDMQGAVGVDRTISKNITGNLTYLYSRGIHQYLSDNINAPLYDYTTGTVGDVPYPGEGNLYQYQSNGILKQSQLITTINAHAKRYSVTGFYVFGSFKSDTQGAGYFPSRQYDIAFDYGRSSNDVRHRVGMFNNFELPYRVMASAILIANSGAPYNITTGRDLNRDNQYNDRPSVAPASLCSTGDPDYHSTRYGCLDVNPKAGEPILPYGSGRGPANFSMDMRLSKSFGIGPVVKGAKDGPPGGGGPPGGFGGGHGMGGLGPGGLTSNRGGMGGPPQSHAPVHKYSLTFAAYGRNVFNVVNLAQPGNVVTSRNFDKSLALSTGFFSRNQSTVRTVDLQVNFNF